MMMSGPVGINGASPLPGPGGEGELCDPRTEKSPAPGAQVLGEQPPSHQTGVGEAAEGGLPGLAGQGGQDPAGGPASAVTVPQPAHGEPGGGAGTEEGAPGSREDGTTEPPRQGKGRREVQRVGHGRVAAATQGAREAQD